MQTTSTDATAIHLFHAGQARPFALLRTDDSISLQKYYCPTVSGAECDIARYVDAVFTGCHAEERCDEGGEIAMACDVDVPGNKA